MIERPANVLENVNMQRSLIEILCLPTLKSDVTELDALIVAFNAIEDNLMKGLPNRISVLATIKNMIADRSK